eukprot:5585755-Pyramimonas_sp.AAC.1
MTSGRLVLVDEGGEVERRKAQPELKSRTQASPRRDLNASVLSWEEFLCRKSSPGGGGGGEGG